jgi:hypothetical protein
MPSYSKGSQGLSVFLRVDGICTVNSISLSPWLRQWGSRYAIRAGRNLPDKEFRSSLLLLDLSQKGKGELVISANLPTSLQGTDFILICLDSSVMQFA